MKKFLRTFLIVIFCVSQTTFSLSLFNINHKNAFAESEYLRIINDHTAFYLNASEATPLFYIPYTYYVKPLNVVGEYTHVEWCGAGGVALDGYVKTSELFSDDLEVSNPYLSLNITTCSTAVLYSDSSLITPLQYVFPERTMRYYGSYVFNGTNVFYVEYNGKLGYVKETDVYPFAIANHPNELTFIIPDEKPIVNEQQPTVQEQEEELFSLKIIIVACLLFAGIVALFIALKQKPQQKINASYYDENEYE